MYPSRNSETKFGGVAYLGDIRRVTVYFAATNFALFRERGSPQSPG